MDGLSDFGRKMRETLVKGNLESLLLLILNKHNMCGYDIVSTIREKLGVLLSPGVVYPALHRLERYGLIKGKWSTRKRIYILTDKGKSAIEQVIVEFNAFKKFVLSESER